MSEQCCDILRCDPGDLKQAMSIHTRKITDSCRDKDCIEDLRVFLTTGSQTILDTCTSARVRSAELLYTYIDVEPVAFDGHHYCINITFYYKILADAVIGAGRPASLYGLALFSKRAVLCGEDSRAHIFRSNTVLGGPDGLTIAAANLPTAVVDATGTNQPGTYHFQTIPKRIPRQNQGICICGHGSSVPLVTCECYGLPAAWGPLPGACKRAYRRYDKLFANSSSFRWFLMCSAIPLSFFPLVST